MFLVSSAEHPYSCVIDTLKDGKIKFFNPRKLNDPRYDRLPLTIRVFLEAAIRNCDGFYTTESDVENILDWQQQQDKTEVPFTPARVLLQDFTGIPAMVDLAAMRDAVAKHGEDPSLINPKCPTDLIVDHSLQIDFSKCAIQNAPNPGGGESATSPRSVPSRLPSRGGSHCGGQQGSCGKAACSDPPAPSGARPAAVQQIENTPLLCPFHLKPVSDCESKRKSKECSLNRKVNVFPSVSKQWCSKAFKNVNVVPPDVGAVHQVNLEYLSRVVQVSDGVMYPDSVVGTDSHTTMINGLGILGWGVGGIESEAVMLGQPVSLTLPQVVGCKLVGSINPLSTSIDIVLGITKHLRQAAIAGRFVEFFGPGLSQLSAPDRTTIANMCPEYNATVSFFPIDQVTLKHFKKTNFSHEKLELMESYMKAIKLFRSYEEPCEDPQYSEVIEINLSSMVPHVSGPKRPQDRVAVSNMKADFQSCLDEKVGFKGFHISKEKQETRVAFLHCGQEYQLVHGSVVIAAVISCTNNCNPSVMLTAGLLAKKAVEAGLTVKPYIRTSLAPGSGMVTHYLNSSGVLPYFSQLGFQVIGYGCATCVGNTAPLPDAVVDAIKQGDLVTCGLLSGNRHFEGRLCDCVRANYLASPPLVVAYAIAGTVGIDFEKEPLGLSSSGKEVYLSDIWPSREEVQQTEEDTVISSVFKDLRGRMEIFCSFKDLPAPQSIENAHALLFLGDKVSTDHISPAGSIARASAAAKYLQSRRLTPREFNSYGARRGNDAVMTRGTFASIKLLNRFIGKPGPKTLHIPSGQTLDVFEAADRYQRDGVPLIILAGKEYGSGNSRDWVAKGPFLLGVRAVIAESFEKLHKSQLVGMGIMPLQFLPGQSADSLELSGKERFSIVLPESLSPSQHLTVKTSKGTSFSVTALFDSQIDVILFQHGGLLRFVARTFLGSSLQPGAAAAERAPSP
uniref:Iron-responsive element-binding protein 2 n=1 Tax=Oryzias melastigma TaxID=30732 RepID=A0A3B3D2T2_ORYME